MQRIAIQLKVRADKIEEYDQVHANVWPELLAEMTSLGITDYSIFRRGQDLFLYMHVPDFPNTIERLMSSEVNRRWQERMTPIFEPMENLRPGEVLPFMRQVFYMAGNNTSHTKERNDES